MQFSRAIARLPGTNFADGLTQQSAAGRPDFQRTLEQHRRYVDALERCGVRVTTLAADAGYPDGTFVEDTAVLTPDWAILARPGAATRAGEVPSIAQALPPHFADLAAIESPGTVDGGDICEAGSHYFIGLSQRTNEEGARQLAVLLAARGCTSSVVDIRASRTLLHLKTGIAFLGDDCLVVTDDLPPHADFGRFRQVRVEPAESYAANCIRVNDRVLVATGFPRFSAALAALGFQPLELDMSEFRKMDGGLSCLSLRF